MDRDQIVDRIAHAIRMQQAVQTTSFPATPDRLAEAALGVVEDTYRNSSVYQVARRAVIDECIQAISGPLTIAAPPDVISAVQDLNELHIEALRSLKGESDG